MSGHLGEAAQALHNAALQVPIQVNAATHEQLNGVMALCQQTGGPIGEELAEFARSIQSDLESVAQKLSELHTRLTGAAQQIMSRGY